MKTKKTGPLDPDEILADSTSALRFLYGHENRMERSLSRLTPFFFILFIGAGFLYLGTRAVSLQLQKGSEFLAQSQKNRFFERPLFSPRGVLYDRLKVPLTENKPFFGAVFSKDQFIKKGGELSVVLQQLEEILQQPPEFFMERGFPQDGDVTKLPSRIFINENLSVESLVELSLQLDKLPGVQIFESYRRTYVDSSAFSHLLGFVGKLSEEDLVAHPTLRNEETIGKDGLEAFYDELLRGKLGKKIVEVDSSGQETRFRLTQEPQSGTPLLLTVDEGLQRVSYEKLEHYIGGRKGASVVAVDPRDGSVLALVSYPGFDSNRFGYSLTKKEFETVLKNPLKPLFNRAVGGEFPSGSTIKPFIGAAALEEKIIDPNEKIFTQGFIEIPNPYKPGERTVFLDWKNHGWVNFYDAIAQSVNVYFYTVGGGYKGQRGLGIEKIKKYALAFGFGSKLGLDLPGEKTGFFPDPETKKITEPEDPIWRVGDTYNVSIGQGGVKVTPLQLASAVSAIANGGRLYQPHLLDAILDESEQVKEKFPPRIIRENVVSKESIEQVRRGMRQTVTSGTARLLGSVPVAVAAKTGTAQVGTNKLPHALVTAFAPVENPEIAIVVMVENAGEGATVAVPITHDILQWYFQSRKLSTVD